MPSYVYAIRQQFNESSGQFDAVPEVLEFTDRRDLRDFIRGNECNRLSYDEEYLKILKIVEGQAQSPKQFL